MLKSAPPKRYAKSPARNYNESHGPLRNEVLERKTAAIQREYDHLLNEMLDMRHKMSFKGDDQGFYWAMNDYLREYGGSSPHRRSAEKHGPNHRLIQMKNTAVNHKKVMHDQGFTRDSESLNYQLTYISSPGKSYVIEPHKGQLNYGLVDRNPEKFYD